MFALNLKVTPLDVRLEEEYPPFSMTRSLRQSHISTDSRAYLGPWMTLPESVIKGNLSSLCELRLAGVLTPSLFRGIRRTPGCSTSARY